MDPSAPWWGTAVIALAGVMLTLFVGGRRESRSRWAAEKRSAYVELLVACKQLRDLSVWPTDRAGNPADVAPALARVRDSAEHVGLIASRSVARRSHAVVGSAKEFVAAIEKVRRDSQPGHQGTVDERQRPVLDAAKATFIDDIRALTNAARSDIRAGRGLRRDWFSDEPPETA